MTYEVQQQGEVRIERIEALPDGVELRPFDEKTDAKTAWIISHSERGHHHVLDCADVDVLERPLPAEFGEGMRILYAIVRNPTEMRQDAAIPHETAPLEPGFYRLTVSTEVDPFTKQARYVAD